METSEKNFHVLEQRENFLAGRKEVKIILKAEKNPSYEEALEVLSRHFKSDKESIVVREVKGKFGRNTFLVSGFIYKTKEDKEKFEPKKKEKKGQAQAKPEEKPAEVKS